MRFHQVVLPFFPRFCEESILPDLGHTVSVRGYNKLIRIYICHCRQPIFVIKETDPDATIHITRYGTIAITAGRLMHQRMLHTGSPYAWLR